MSEREQFGFQRTRCGCDFCRIPCRHVPGGLDVADLDRLCPAGVDVFPWAEQHLRARTDKSYPVLVPARQPNGHCHWHFDGKCAVHDHAPYGCAFFDSHMPQAEVERRYAASVQARVHDAESNGIYTKVWRHLCAKLLTDQPGCPDALKRDLERIQRSAQRARNRRLRV